MKRALLSMFLVAGCGGEAGLDLGTGGGLDVGGPGSTTSSGAWLRTEGNRILKADGTPFVGKGANIHDTRSCGACTNEEPNVDEVLRRVDALVDDWNADFIRLDLEAYTDDPAQTHGKGVLADPAYFADVERIVRHATDKGVYVLLSMWHDPTIDEMGWPTAATGDKWAAIAERFVDEPRVLFGIVNEPQQNYDGALDDQVRSRMNDVLSRIRAVEDAHGGKHHVVVAQGTGGWARFAQHYVDAPLPGDNVAYEIHVYNPQADFERLLAPAATIPLIIGELGPVEGTMTMDDADELVRQAKARGIPFLAWTFHQRCAPSLLADASNGSCGVDMPLNPSEWGARFKAHLAD